MMGDVNEAKVMYDSMPERNVIASNSMIVLLGRCGRLSEARRLFDEVGAKDLVSWTALISCYEQSGMYEEALTMFAEMNCCGIGMDEVVLVSVLSACTHLSIVKTGEMIHRLSLRIGIDSYVNLQNALIHMYSTCGNILAAENLFKVSCQLDQISWNSMISGYLKCGKSDKARELFDSMTEKDIVTWSAMISGYAQLGLFAETLTLFQMMLHQEVRPDEVTFVSVISACTHLAALSQGKWEKQPSERIEVSKEQALICFLKINFRLKSSTIYQIHLLSRHFVAFFAQFEEAKKYDHRELGKKQEFFTFHKLSPGSRIILPHGRQICLKLLEFLRSQYWKRGYKELWETSGHAANYKENMFALEVEGQQFALKPMNCPGHCLIFDSKVRSYRELPLRIADFGVLHWNELSGALTGLTRVVFTRMYRKLCDGCKVDVEELVGCLLLLQLWAWERLPTPAPARNSFPLVNDAF
ncbi:hypothetical protein ACET3Z_024479 [Daucus carota]